VELTPVLEVRALTVRYRAHQALDSISFDLGEGEALAIVGANGAGRTTLLQALAGITPIAGGTVRWRGRDITTLTTARRVTLGISMVAGTQATFPNLSVADNLRTGCHHFAWDLDRVTRCIDDVTTLFPRLGERSDQIAGSLSGGEQQMLAIAKALVGEPRLLLLDEPSLGLASDVVDLLAAATRGLTMVVVEQSLDTASAFAGRALHLDRGKLISDGPLGITPPAGPEGVQS
jgi:branched-chain amino acid transport system ATP-binding protein